ncbi:hypothetical protein ACSBR2_037938 [Camellia fascicularis]
MNNSSMASMLILSLICLFNFYPTMAQTEKIPLGNEPNTLKTYIVHVNWPEIRVFSGHEDVKNWYHSFLPTTTATSNKPSSSRMVYSYHNVVNGFAARLSAEEVKAMGKIEGFVSARPQRVYSLRTTHSPSLLGLNLNFGAWKGSNNGKGTACNNKLIGTRNFLSGQTTPPFETLGHGTHTASAATGNLVKGANVFGQANGTAAGMVSLAHLAIYKVCTEFGCSEVDMLAAMDAAVEEGILSLSIGGPSIPFYDDGIAVGAFGPIKKGIFVSCSAGNSEPFNASLANKAPWILTVGTSTIDRSIRTTVVLGNNESYDGQSVFQPSDFPSNLMPLVDPSKDNPNSALCSPGSLDKIDVKGKVVLCQKGYGGRIMKGQTVKDAGGAAMILMNAQQDGYSSVADTHVLPISHVSFAAGMKIKEYINSIATPMATIMFKRTIIRDVSAPVVTSFSSRGPNIQSPGILKPDITGPGVSIIVGWPVSVENKTYTPLRFNIISGISMSCPHFSGIAALIKSAHPEWSPAAINSAIMTTADQLTLTHADS